ncbi:ribonucleoside-diphosphate reductase (RRM1) [Vairimorpha necatrix]|uniref:Ribonucleoside-diphosphate reductase n=1 Tax=Vairimorpha necatrix TaxID=6039 RepID=A0AAX4JDQ8_9MICR
MEEKRRKKNSNLSFEIIKQRINNYIKDMSLINIDKRYFIDKVSSGWCDDMTPKETINYVCDTAASMMTIHPEYGKLGSRLLICHLHEMTLNKFSEKVFYLQKHRNLFNPEIYDIIVVNKDIIDDMIDYSRDYSLTFFSLTSLMKSYLLKFNDEIVERPQDVFMRVALQLHRDDWEKVKETYNLISNLYFTHATPTLYNSCTNKNQLASCFLMNPLGDSIEGIYDTLKQCAIISKFSGGIGLNLHSIRANGADLVSTGGKSRGIIPLIQVLNHTSKYINQGGSKRSSSISIYLEPWHKDIFDFLDLRKNTGSEDIRARNIFIALWINDLFMERVDKNEEWSLFCPNEAQGLDDVWGEEFNKLYLKYEKTKNRTVIKARKLWKSIIEAQIETGTPYMLYKDTCNRLSNQQNLGTIKSSNLCAEIVEYSDKNEIAVCNLASICLSKFVINGKFDFQKLSEIVKVIVRNLNICIDKNFYPVKECKTSNLRHRPIGIGVQGLADAFVLMRYPFDSQEARDLNFKIFEMIYFSALEESVNLAKEFGPYETFEGSPLSKGIFHFELCQKKIPDMEKWEILRSKLKMYGARNSLLVAPMPTASTSQIFNNNECFEPFTSNIYTRRTHAGEFQIVNEYLLQDLIKLNLWSHEMKNMIIEFEGSIQNIKTIPQEIRDLYKTAWEIKMKHVIDLAADRQIFIDQSQSLNLFVAQPTYSKLSSMHFYAFKNGLKTGMYYLRTRPITSAIKFTVDQKLLEKSMSSINDIDEVCDACSA